MASRDRTTQRETKAQRRRRIKRYARPRGTNKRQQRKANR